MPDIILFLLLLQVKHFLADGPLQTAYQYLHKGDPEHPGGYVHAAIHYAFTLAICVVMGVPAIIACIDPVSHYIIDYYKVNLTKRKAWSRMVMRSIWKPDELSGDTLPPGLLVTSNNFFHALMADQLAHQLVYVFIVWVAYGS